MPGCETQTSPTRLLFLIPHPFLDPSGRYRVYQFREGLERAGYACTIRPFTSERFFALLSRPGRLPAKTVLFLACAVRRLVDLLQAGRFAAVIVHRELFPLGPPLFEPLLLAMARRVVLDYDDALFLPVPHVHRLPERLKGRSRLEYLLRHSSAVWAGNEYLAQHARQVGGRPRCLPTVVDAARFGRAAEERRPPANEVILGWIGSADTGAYLQGIGGALQRVADRAPVRLLAIGSGRERVAGIGTEARSWSYEREVSDLAEFHIGLSPLPDDRWAQGKCGLKLLQYLAAGLPTVSSAVGVHRQIVKDGDTGFLARDEEEWCAKLEALVGDEELRRRMGQAGRETVIGRYDLEAGLERLKGALAELLGEEE